MFWVSEYLGNLWYNICKGMADQGRVHEGQCDGEPRSGTIGATRQVPANLLDFLRSRIVLFMERAENISAEIHEFPGQPARLVVYGAKFGE